MSTSVDQYSYIQSVRALIDSASQISIIKNSCADILGLRRTKWTVPLTGLSDISFPHVDGFVHCTISPRYSADNDVNVKAWIFPKITGGMPSRLLPKTFRDNFANLALADPDFDRPSPIDILLGADVFAQIVDGKRVVINDILPVEFGILFGWILVSPVSDYTPDQHQSNLVSLIDP